MPKRKMPDSVRMHIAAVRVKHRAAIKLIDGKIADEKLRTALKEAGVSHVLVEQLTINSLRTARSRKMWRQVVYDDFMRMLTHYAVEYDVSDEMFDK
jgi:hypothetical protein